jgi:hypothetical protein
MHKAESAAAIFTPENTACPAAAKGGELGISEC